MKNFSYVSMSQFYSNYKSSMDSSVVFHNARLGAPTSPMHAKQLEEFGKRLNSGVRNIEVGTIDPDKFEFIPTQHFETIRQLAQLNDVQPSLHGPLMDLSGFDERSGRWSEADRKGTVERVWSILERGQLMSPKDPKTGKVKENLPVVFHAGSTFAQEYAKGLQEEEIIQDEKTGKITIKKQPYKEGIQVMSAVNTQTGEVTRLNWETKRSLLGGEERIHTPHDKLRSLNKNQWDEEKLRVFGYQKELDELKQKIELKEKQIDAIEKTGLIQDPEYQKIVNRNFHDIQLLGAHIKNVHEHLESSIGEAANKWQKSFTSTTNSDFKEEAQKFLDAKKNLDQEIKKRKQEYFDELKKVKKLEEAKDKATGEQKEIVEREWLSQQRKAQEKELDITRLQVTEVTQMPTPEIWRPVGEFSRENTVKTISEVMMKAYNKFKEDAPMLAVENFWPNTPMSSAKELKQAVDDARKLFTEQLIKEKGLHKDKAEQVAEKLIAATWDIGHIYNLRKAGYEGKELEKEVIEQTKHIAPVTRHVHVTDNFGFHDSHLAPGMGQVPVAQIMKELDKKWSELREQGKLQIEPRSIVEAGGLVGEIGQDPTIPTLRFFNSPLYKMGTQAGYGPQWRDSALPGYHTVFTEFPQQHFNLYGSSFSTLPKELGGQITGDKSRFSDTPST